MLRLSSFLINAKKIWNMQLVAVRL